MNSAVNLRSTPECPIYIVTLCSSPMPMPIRVPFVHQLEGFSVFRSRRVEEGRERFRLHVGYFDSLARAREALPVIRDAFPAAWVELAPPANGGSLDDTLTTVFDLVRRGSARVIGSKQFGPAPTSFEVKGSVDAAQRYVVQLDWSDSPIESSSFARLQEFRGYDLYSVLERRDGRARYGIRLGFFKNVRLAKRMAAQLHSLFPSSHALPISHREYSYAIERIYRRTRMVIDDLDSPQSESCSQRAYGR